MGTHDSLAGRIGHARIPDSSPAAIGEPSHSSTIHPADTLVNKIGDQVPSDPTLFDQPAEPQSPDPCNFDLAHLGTLESRGIVWVLRCNDEQTKSLVHNLDQLGKCGGGEVAIAVGAAIPLINLMNWVGGHNGVDINGVFGRAGVIVTPHGALFETLVELARVGVNVATVIELIVAASAHDPVLAQNLGLSAAAAIFSQVASGTPLGVAAAIVFGLALPVLGHEPDINDHGAVHADRDQIGPWESFYLGDCGEHTHVAILSWQGFFSAQMGGGHGVYANRVQVGDWERWRIIDNHDGTVSLQTFDGHYLCAEEGGGRECQANRTQIGDWEKFYLECLPGGKVAFKTFQGHKYVSVQKDS